MSENPVEKLKLQVINLEKQIVTFSSQIQKLKEEISKTKASEKPPKEKKLKTLTGFLDSSKLKLSEVKADIYNIENAELINAQRKAEELKVKLEKENKLEEQKRKKQEKKRKKRKKR